MKALYKISLGAVLLVAGAAANAQMSANVGWASEYHFRGILQKVSSASGGLDYESGGFYVGTWAADVGDGLEVDGYFYTGDFDDTYQEINLGGAFAGLSLDDAIGQYDNFTGPTLDYTFAALTFEHEGFYGTYGTFSQDFDGDYLELGYGTTISEIDFGISLILANDDLVGNDDESLIFTIGKSFDL